VISPGGEGEIKAVFKTGHFQGKVRKTIRVYSNDPDAGIVTLSLTGTVYALVELNPLRVSLKRVPADTMIELTVRALPGKGKTLKVKNVKVTKSQVIKVKTKSIKEKGKKGVLFKLKIGPNLPEGRLSEKIIADGYIDNSKEPVKIEIPVTAFVLGPIEVSPPVLTMGVVTIGKKVSKSLTLKSTRGKGFKITDVNTNGIEGLEVDSIVKLDEGKLYHLYFTFNAQGNPNVVSGKILVKTDMPEKSEVKVPFYARTIQQ
jgi:hypothetical protein